jgi:poly(3-hydroxybutyrate) depolymerase
MGNNSLRQSAIVVGIFLAVVFISAQRRGRDGAPPEPGSRRGQAPASSTAQRIQKRTYLFSGTNIRIEYDVFASTKIDKKVKAPLVIALHGAGAPPAQMLRYVTDLAQAGGYVVAAPMGYSLDGWYGIQLRVPRDAKPANLAELSERDVMNVLDLMRKEFNIDDHRIYLLGQSMGGAGALYLGVKYHDIWAAVGATAPAAGSLSPSSLEEARDVPMILVHGDADQNVSVAASAAPDDGGRVQVGLNRRA